MKEFEELKNIWQQQTPHTIADAENLLSHVGNTRKQLSRSLLRAILQLIPAFVVVLCVALFIDFNSIYTYTGIAIVLVCIAVYGLLMFQHYRGLAKDYSLLKPSEYLIEMEKQYNVRKKFNTVGGFFYSIILYVGIMLYMIEVTQSFTVMAKILGFALVTGWFLFVYFVLSKKVMKTENEKFETIIKELQELKEQLN